MHPSVYDRGQGKGAGPVSAPLICYNLGERVEGDCPEKGAGYCMKNGFSYELFSAKLASSKYQPISYRDPLLHRLLNELLLREIRPVIAALRSVLCTFCFHVKNGFGSELF
jgi:hypothetical protein